jgi:hypothetical protein
VIHSYRIGASTVSILITVIALFVADKFISTKDYFVLIGYASGNGIGTYLGMYLVDYFRKNKI